MISDISKDPRISLVLLLMYWLSGCEHETHHEIEHHFQATHPWRQDVTVKKTFVAQLKASQHIELRAMEKGYLEKIYIDEGQTLKKGQSMFQIMPMILQAEQQKAKAEYNLAEIEYRTTESLVNRQVVSDIELALVKAKLDRARAELNLREAHLGLSVIRAPFDGIVDRFRVRLGSLVDEGELLTNLSDNRTMWAYFNVSEVDYLDFMEGKKAALGLEVELQLANGRIFDQPGRLDAIEADFDPETGNIPFRAAFKNPNSLLRHGETGTVILKEDVPQTLVVPQKATFEILDKHFVYVVDQDGHVQSRQVEVGHEIPHLFTIKSGLSTEDIVLIEGLGRVHAKDSVEIVLESQDAVVKSLELSAE